MSDLKKSVVLRVVLWVGAMAVVGIVVILADLALDKLPIWLAPNSDHHSIEATVFWGVVGIETWRWLSRRVWIGTALTSDGKGGTR